MIRTKAWALAAAGVGAMALGACSSMQKVQSWAGGSPCRDTTVTLYFETGSDAVSDVGGQIIGVTASRLKRCRVTEITLLGLADPSGSPQSNLDLSKRRADHVLDAFVHAGLPVPKYTLVAAGANGAVDAAGAVEPVRRRVDVTVKINR
jgi:outer membrane protein OmpA-like peptidoglycan-associated protein